MCGKATFAIVPSIAYMVVASMIETVIGPRAMPPDRTAVAIPQRPEASDDCVSTWT